jgi:hypothetical protein
VGGPSTLAPGHPHLPEGCFPARGACARVFFDREATSVPPAPARMPGGLTAPRVAPRVTSQKAEKPQSFQRWKGGPCSSCMSAGWGGRSTRCFLGRANAVSAVATTTMTARVGINTFGNGNFICRDIDTFPRHHQWNDPAPETSFGASDEDVLLPDLASMTLFAKRETEARLRNSVRFLQRFEFF